MNTALTDALVRTSIAMVPPPPREPRTGGWCSDPVIQQEMDEAWEYRQTMWKEWKRGKGTNGDKQR